MNTLDFDILMKVLVVGQASVGKSSLLNRWANNRFSITAATTVGIDFKIKSIIHNGKKVSIQVWDTAGQERYAPVQRSYYKGSHAVIIVFDVTKPETFEKVTTRWQKDINDYAGEHVQVTLVGNKADLEEERLVTTEQATALAEQYGYDYLETSAKTAAGVEELFMKLVERLYEKKSYIENQSSTEAASPASPLNKQPEQDPTPSSVFAAEPHKRQNLPAPIITKAEEPVVVLDGSKKQVKPKQASSERGGCC